jgi:uncharacterized membrane protein
MISSKTAERELTDRVNNRRQHLSILLPILLVYFVLACYGLEYQSLWIDEILSVRDAASASTIWKKAQGPLHFAMLHVWMHLGTSEVVLRALSVLVGAVALCLFYAMCTILYDKRVTLIGTMLFATSPYVIWYSQEVRYIIVMLAATLLSMYTLRRLSVHSRWAMWLAYGSSVALALAAFVANVFLPLAQGLYLLWSPSRRRLLGAWIVCVMLASVPFGVWVSSKVAKTVQVETTASDQQRVSIDPKQLSRGSYAARTTTPAIIPYTFFVFSAGLTQGPSVHELHKSQSLATLLSYAPILVSLGLLFGGLFLVGLIAIWRQPDVGKFLTLWLCIPLLGVWGLTFITNLGYNVRYTTMVFPAYLLILAAGITWFPRTWLQVTLLVAVLVSNGVSLANYYFNPSYAREDVRAAVQYLESVRRSRDVFLAVGDTHALHYYSQGTLPFERLAHVSKLDRPPIEVLRDIVRDHDRSCLIEVRPWQSDPDGKWKAALGGAYPLIEQKQFAGGVSINCYRLSK